jgi:protein-tyrosine-phosphatase
MILAVQGSKNFTSYDIFLRALGSAMYDMTPEDDRIVMYSAGPRRVNEMCIEFSNVSERSLKGRGISIKTHKMPAQWMEENLHIFDTVIYLSKPKEPETKLVKTAEAKDIDVRVYRY